MLFHAELFAAGGPTVVLGFERSEHFQELVFQPSGLQPVVGALKRRRLKLSVLGGSISLQQRGYRVHLVEALRRRGVEVEDLVAAVGTAGSRALALVISELVLKKQPDLLIIEDGLEIASMSSSLRRSSANFEPFYGCFKAI